MDRRMEQVVAERTLSQEQRPNQLHGLHNGTINNGAAHLHQGPPQRQHPSWTGRDNSNFSGGHICRDYSRGSCARGSSCKFRHNDYVSHDEARFCRNERRDFSSFVDSRNAQFYAENKDGDFRKRPFFAEQMSRSPCRKFQSGTCFRGSSCSYLHSAVTKYDRSSYWKEPYAEGATSRNSGSHEVNFDNNVKVSHAHDEADNGSNSRPTSFFREPRARSPCRNFLRGNCQFGASCKRFHPVDKYNHNLSAEQKPRVAASGNPTFGGRGREFSSHERYGTYQLDRNRTGSFPGESTRSSVCQYFLRGSCSQGRSCVNLHPTSVYERTRYDLSARHQQGFIATSRYHRFDDNNLCKVESHGPRPCQDRLGGGTAFVDDADRSKNLKSLLANERLAYDRGTLNVNSRRWSSERPRASNDGVDKLRPEICQRFTRGRCVEGDSCKYVHSYHEYASSVLQRSRRPQSEDSADIANTNGSYQPAAIIVAQEQHTSRIENKSSSEEARAHSVIDAVDLSANQKVKELATVERECESPVEGNEDIQLRAKLGKRRKSRSRSPFGHCAGTVDFSKENKDDSEENTLEPPHPNQIDAHLDTDCVMADISDNANATNQQSLVSDLKCSAEDHLVSQVHVLEKVETAGGTVTVSPDEKDSAQTIHEVKTYSRKRKRKPNNQPNSSECCLESLTEEVTETPSKEPPTSSSVEEISLDRPDAVSVSGLSEDLNTNASKSNVLEKVLQNEQPLKRKRKRGIIVKAADDVVESSSAATNLDNNLLPPLKPLNPATRISKRKLLVLDVNGLLADIVGDYPDGCEPDAKVSGKGLFKRPFCDDFLRFCFQRFDVGIWSSRTKKNVIIVVNFLLKKSKKKLLFCWDQSHCTQTGYKTVENQDKPLVLKELKKLWEKMGGDLPWEKGFYNETNTVLLDDSPYKALRNPPHTAVFPFPYSFMDGNDNSLGPGGDLRLYLERLAKAENVQRFIQENPFGQKPISKTNLSWAFYSKIVGNDASKQEKKKKKKCEQRA